MTIRRYDDVVAVKKRMQERLELMLHHIQHGSADLSDGSYKGFDFRQEWVEKLTEGNRKDFTRLMEYYRERGYDREGEGSKDN